jgi:predicted nucleic acid-binding protein
MRQVTSTRRGRAALGACGVLAALCGTGARADVADPDALIAALARTPPTSVAFTEARFSALLLAPIVVAGELAYSAPGALDRIVTAPHRERTSIAPDSVTVAREGERARTFALRRAPELRGLLAAMTALLAGDAAGVRRDFDVTASGDAGTWKLELTPRDAAVQRRLTKLVATGAGADLQCFAMRNADGGTTVMLLGAAVGDGIAADTTLASLLDRCRAE